MKEIKEELERKLEELQYEEIGDIYVKAVTKMAINAIKEIDRRAQSTSSLTSVSKKVALNHIVGDIADNKIEFLKWMNEHKQGIYNQCEKEVKEQNPERTDIIYTMEAFMEFLNLEETDVFLEFDQLTNIFKYINFDVNYQLRMLSNIVKNNIELDEFPDANTFVPDIPGLLEYKYEHITRDEVIELLRTSQLEEYLKSDDPDSREAREELLNRFNETKHDYTDRQTACRNLHKVFSKPICSLTEEDYHSIIVDMNTIFFGHLANRLIKFLKKNNTISQNFYEYMESEKEISSVKKPLEKTKVSGCSNNKEKKKVKPELEMPKKQTSLNQTLREINKYFELDTRKLKEFLSLDQIIYVLSLMYSINLDNSIIDSFLRSAMREFKNLHPYALYNQAYDKFIYLGQENPEIQEHLDMIEYILSEASIFICTKEKYMETKRLIEAEINEIVRLTNGDYSYEIENAKNLIK